MAKSEIKMKMSLDSSGVTKALARTKTKIKEFADFGIQKLGGLAKVGMAGLVTGFAAASKAALSYGKEMTNLSNIAGAGFIEFQKLAAGAKTVGIESEKLADIYKDVNDKLGDFIQTGGGPLKDFFENIAPAVGVTVDQFKALSGPEALQLYFNSLEKANLSQKDMTFYMEAIASDATALIPLLKNNGEAFVKFGEDVEEGGRLMDEATRESLKNAEDALDKFRVKLTIMAGETLMGFKIIAEAAESSDVKAGIQGIGKLITGLASSNSQMLKRGADDITSFFTGMDQGAEDAFNKMHGNAQVFEMDFSDVSNNIKNDFIDTTEAITESDRKAKEKRKKESEALARIQEKINDEQRRQNGLTLTTEEKLEQATQRRIELEKELAEIDEANDPKAKLEKQLELTKAITAEKEAESRVEKETNEVIKLKQELKEAILRNDLEAVDAVEEALDVERQIQQVMEDHNVGREKAVEHVNALIAKEKEQADANKAQNAEREEAEERLKQLQLDQIRAQAAGNDDLAAELQKRIDKEQEAIDLMNRFTISIDEARQMAEKLAAVNAAPDGLDAFQRGGRIENVSKKKRDTGSPRERAERAREERRRKRENDRINRERDPERRQALIDAENKRRAGIDPKVGGQPPNGGEPKVGGQPPNGPDGKKGPDPKKPEDPAKTTNKKLDKQITLLEDIKKALQC